MTELISFTLNYLQGLKQTLGDKYNDPTRCNITLVEGQNYSLDVYIIDVQHGFMYDGECSVVEANDYFIDDIIHFLNKMIQDSIISKFPIQLRFFFSRDYHHPEHKSFVSKDNPNGFPAHCQYGTKSSAFHPKIKKWILDNVHLNIMVLFKAFHPDIESFSAIPYSESIYGADQRQGSCLDSYKTHTKEELGFLMDGGGVYLPYMHLATAVKDNPFGSDITPESTPEEIKKNAENTLKTLIENGVSFSVGYLENTIHINYVIGLAGDFCVRDTIINQINHMDNIKATNMCCLVPTLTRYIALPIGDKDTAGAMTKSGKYVDEKTTEADSVDGKYFVWAMPPKQLAEDYMNPAICCNPPIVSDEGLNFTY